MPLIAEMQSEAGAAAAVHGALQTGSLSTTFTASQGLLLMIPTMYKIAGELTPTCWHVTARLVGLPGAQHLRRPSGRHGRAADRFRPAWPRTRCRKRTIWPWWARAATLKARVPFIHFFDGFRTSHEVQKIELMGDDVHAGHDRRGAGARPIASGP